MGWLIRELRNLPVIPESEIEIIRDFIEAFISFNINQNESSDRNISIQTLSGSCNYCMVSSTCRNFLRKVVGRSRVFRSTPKSYYGDNEKRYCPYC